MTTRFTAACVQTNSGTEAGVSKVEVARFAVPALRRDREVAPLEMQALKMAGE